MGADGTVEEAGAAVDDPRIEGEATLKGVKSFAAMEVFSDCEEGSEDNRRVTAAG